MDLLAFVLAEGAGHAVYVALLVEIRYALTYRQPFQGILQVEFNKSVKLRISQWSDGIENSPSPPTCIILPAAEKQHSWWVTSGVSSV